MVRHSSIMVSRTLYQIGVVTLLAAIMWVLIGIYIAAKTTTVTEVEQAVLQPINPTLDQEVMTALSQRLKIEIDSIPIEAPIEIPTEIATESATIVVEEEGI